MSDELNTLFHRSNVPAPSADLADRIAANIPARPANDRAPWWPKLVAGASAVAATVLAVGMIYSGSTDVETDSEVDLWASAASDAGFAELYAWVEDEG